MCLILESKTPIELIFKKLCFCITGRTSVEECWIYTNTSHIKIIFSVRYFHNVDLAKFLAEGTTNGVGSYYFVSLSSFLVYDAYFITTANS